MRDTCSHVVHMSIMIQIRNVPDDLHRTLKLRAVAAGMTLSDYLKAELTQIAGRVTMAEMAERLRTREPIEHGTPVVELLHELRGER